MAATNKCLAQSNKSRPQVTRYISFKEPKMKSLILTACILACTVGSANAQCTYRLNDKGRFHGYLSGPCNGSVLGLAGAYPARSNSATQAHQPKIGCDWLCQSKCQATWQRGNLPSVEACYTKWSRLNTMGIARQCEAANRARLAGQPRLPGC
jgi:hypothetical protein